MKLSPMPFLPALSLLLVTSALAQRQIFTVDPDASKVQFTLGASLHSVEGSFHVQSGSVEFDSSSPAMSGSIVVGAASASTNDKSRDKKMKSDVLEVSRFVDVSFVPKSYQGTIAPSGDSQLQVSGIFTLHGTPHDLTAPMQIHIEGSKCTARTHFPVPYVKWGLKDPSTFVLHVAKEVQMDLTLVGQISAGQ